ncbi:hypothetical protein C4D60_Mb10t15580 [Musa balbisiana]|uniref:alpha-1,2-Mannosidase n=1 Tax=Musa balbisiana TaxID=52838 RepID=A0A4S8IXB1_MUSBA|nr:hypothetical protein C4D60_Mb10t15580 [Musa balbisiana]
MDATVDPRIANSDPTAVSADRRPIGWLSTSTVPESRPTRAPNYNARPRSSPFLCFLVLPPLFSPSISPSERQEVRLNPNGPLPVKPSTTLPHSMQDIHYDNAKFRRRSPFKVITQALVTSHIRYCCRGCSTGKFLMLLMILGLTYLITHKSSDHSASNIHLNSAANVGHKYVKEGVSIIDKIWRKPPRLPPQLPPDEAQNVSSSFEEQRLHWFSRKQKVKEAFVHAWSGYKNHAMGYDELMPLSQRGTDGLGGLGATIVDSLDTAIIMGADEIVYEAVPWIEKQLVERIEKKGQVNLFETTIRVLGGLLSAYHLSRGDKGTISDSGIPMTLKGVKSEIFLELAKTLADRLLCAFASSPTSIPFSDVVLHDHSAHPAPDGLSSTAEVSTLQLEFNYLSEISGDPKYRSKAMKVLEHIRSLPKVEGLVPIHISPHSGQFNGENIRLGSRGDSYYEYLIKVWIQQKNSGNQLNYLYQMYEEAMRGVRHLLVRKSIPKGLVFVGELPHGSNGSFSPKMDHLVCFLPGTLALGATKGITKKKAIERNLLTPDDLENLKLAEDLAKTCFEIYREWGWQIFEAFEKYTKELELLNENSNVYKLIGPVLVKQDLAEANANVRKRIEYISAELKRLDGTLKESEDKQNSKKESVLQLQQKIQTLQAGKSKS